jgi:glyoxylate reductase
MSRPRIFVTRRLVGDGLERLALDADLEVWQDSDPPPHDVLITESRRSDGLLSTIADRIDADFMDSAPSVRVVSQLAVGYDNIDVEAATQRRLLIANTPGVLTDAVADMAFALMLSWSRRIPEGERVLREGGWGLWSPTFMLGHDLHGKSLGIVGLGQIGQAIARRARGFAMPVTYWSRTRKPDVEQELGIAWRSLEDLLRESDWVSISVSLNAETRGLIGAEQLALMKPTACIVNTARGAIIEQAALLEALKDGRLGGAALDVFEVEPMPTDDPLLRLPNVVVAPHVGSATVETRTRMTDLAVDNLLAFFRGERPPCCVNPEVLANG